ncbi:MAG: tetratricopeptide repeat protein, partial [Pseudomonadota bacterium]
MRSVLRCPARALLLLALLCPAPTWAAQAMRPELAARVLDALGKAETDPEAALKQLENLVRATRSDEELTHVVGERIGLLLAEDQMATARAELEDLLRDEAPDFSPPLRLLYATLLLTEENYSAALVQLDHWETYAEAPHPQGYFLIGYSYVRLERFDAAVPPLEQAIHSEDGPRDPWLELLAYAYTKSGRPEDALTLIERLIAEHPERARWWKQLAGILMLLERLPEGTAALAITEQIEPLTTRDRKRLARLFAHLGMPADGAELLNLAYTERSAAPDFEELMLLGELWMLARETERAIA